MASVYLHLTLSLFCIRKHDTLGYYTDIGEYCQSCDIHYENTPIQYIENFTTKKMKIFR